MEQIEHSKQTNFDKIKEFHKAFGLDLKEKPQTNVFENKDLIKLRLGLINEEVNELHEAIKEKNFTEVIDALSDILYVVYGAGASFGIDLDKAYNIVHKSNMTKLCRTQEEAEETVTWYKKQYEEGNVPYDSPNYRLSDDKKYYVVFNESTGKILKSINYTPANFESFNL